MGECDHCGRQIDNPGGLARHERSCGDRGAKKKYECEHCGSEFHDYPSRRETRGREKFYCSTECKHEGGRTGEWRNCANCGDEIYRPACHLSEMGDYDIDHHFCEKECEREWKRENWVRQGHPGWKGGKGGIDAVRHAFSGGSWIQTANEYREAHDVCEMCGEHANGRALDVHHIIPLAAGGTNEDWNLIALCISCHRKAEQYIRQYTRPHLYELID